MGGEDSAREYRVITDPSEGPKTFTLQTRVTSRGETAVILMGVDCAERVMCHDSVGLDLPEGAFVFNVGPNTSGILDQLLSQGALKVIRVEHARGMPVPVCELTPGGPAQPAFEGPHVRRAADARRAAESAAADASGDAFFDALRAEDAKAQQHAQGAPPGMPARSTPRGAPPGMGVSSHSAGADILAMLNGGAASPAASGNGAESVVRTPPVARQLMPRTTRGSAGGGARVRGGGASHDDGFFDASAGAPSPASVTSALAGGANDTSAHRPGPPPGLSPLGGLADGLPLFGGADGGLPLFGSPAGVSSSPFGAPPAKPPPPGTGDAGADILAALAGPARATPPRAPGRGAPSNEDLLAMLAGGGDSAARASSPAPPPGTPAPLSIDELEAQALASATKAAEKEKVPKVPEEEEEPAGMLSADMGALGLGFLGITTDDDDFALPLRASERKDAPAAAPAAAPTAAPAAAPAAAEEEKETQPGEGEKPKEDKEAARKEKRERKKREKEEEKKRKEEEAAAAAAAKAKAKAAAKASVTSYSSDALLSLRAKCTSAPPEVDMEMFEHADKAREAGGGTRQSGEGGEDERRASTVSASVSVQVG